MKKVILFAVIAIAIVSCGPKKANQTVVNQDSLTNVDTVSTEVVNDTTSVKVDTASVNK